MGHDCDRTESREKLAESEGEAGFEPLGGTIATLVTEGHVDRHLGRSVEEGEQPVADRAGFIEAVDQQAGCTLGAAAARRGDDVQDQRTAVLPEDAPSFPSVLPVVLVGGHRTVAAGSVPGRPTNGSLPLPDLGEGRPVSLRRHGRASGVCMRTLVVAREYPGRCTAGRGSVPTSPVDRPGSKASAGSPSRPVGPSLARDAEW